MTVRFADLFESLDRTTSTRAKVAAMAAYLRAAPPGDAAWAIFLLTGRRLERLLPSRAMHEWVVELSGLPPWIVRECYAAVGDFAETIALLVAGRAEPLDPDHLRQTTPGDAAPRQGSLFGDAPPPFDERVEGVGLQEWIENRLLPLRALPLAERRVRVLAWWSRLSRLDLLLVNKLLTGEFRVGVSRTLVVRAIAEVASLPTVTIEGRLMGDWQPSPAAYLELIAPEGGRDLPARPYPFCLASPLTVPVESLGAREEWLAEWKWDGIRAQLIHRDGEVFLWSRGDELITRRFPEVADAVRRLPAGVVIDGELVAHDEGRPRPFSDLQQRIMRDRRVSETAQAIPVAFLAFDLLEEDAQDIRAYPLRERRARLEQVLAAGGDAVAGAIRLSEALSPPDWEGLAWLRDQSRERYVEGVMLKRWSSPYRAGRHRGDWWKWKIDPFTIDAVLLYAQPGSGRRASLFTDYTFGLWDQGRLVPVAKAYSGLTDQEIDELDRWIRRHTVERFGPVSAVEPVHVFELGFERVARSTRHRSGVAVRFPRILRWRRDKGPGDADTLAALVRLAPASPGDDEGPGSR